MNSTEQKCNIVYAKKCNMIKGNSHFLSFLKIILIQAITLIKLNCHDLKGLTFYHDYEYRKSN